MPTLAAGKTVVFSPEEENTITVTTVVGSKASVTFRGVTVELQNAQTQDFGPLVDGERISITSISGVVTWSATTAAAGGGGAVSSVAGRTGAVVLGESDITNLVADLAAKAPLDSPTFTGTPTVPGYAPTVSPAFTGTPVAPTATAGTNTTQIASTAFVTAAVASGGGAVTSVAGRAGAVVLTNADVSGSAPLASPTFTGTPTLPAGTIAVTQTAGNSSTALATTAFVTTADNLKAPLASPTFTGTPTMPTGTVATTQTAGNSTTAIATTAFVTTANNLKANLASPTFTGVPAVPTATAGTNTTQAASTAFVTTAVASAGGGGGAPQVGVDITSAPYSAVSGTDCTTAIDAMATAGIRNFLVPAGSFTYNGSGIDWSAGLSFKGIDKGVSQIVLGTGKSLVVGGSTANTFTMERLNVTGGYGAIKLTSTGTNVGTSSRFVVRDCDFYNYTGAAISNLFADCPNWEIEDNNFFGVNDTATFGVILSGDAAGSVLSKNSFGQNFCHVKLRGLGGAGVVLDNDDFVYNSTNSGNPRYDLWIVPHTSDGGRPVAARSCKFGPENRTGSMDYPILIADEDTATGTGVADRKPKLTTDSTGYCGLVITDPAIGMNSSGPVIYSTTPNLMASTLERPVFSGATPTMVLQFRTPAGYSAARRQRGLISFPTSMDIGANALLPLSNASVPPFELEDPQAVLDLGPANSAFQIPGGGDMGGYVATMTPGTTNASTNLFGGNTKSVVADSTGGSDAVQVVSTGGIGFYYQLSGLVADELHWIEFDLAPPSSGTAPTTIQIARRIGGSTTDFQRQVTVPAKWRRFRFLDYVSLTTADQLVFTVGSTALNIKIGRVRTYLAREPISIPTSESEVVTYSATVTPVWTAGRPTQKAIGALTGALTVANPATMPAAGTRVSVSLLQDGTGARAVSWGTSYKFPTAWSNTSNTANTRSMGNFVSDGTYLWASGANSWA